MQDQINAATEILKQGGLILYPTDTIWGIGCDATNEEAVKRIYKLKKRSDSKSLIVLVDNDVRLQRTVEEVPEVVKQIKELIDQRVRPAVAMDGGDISFCSFEDGVVTLQMKGACAGCPSSTATLKMGIENMLRHYIPEVVEVKAAEL